MPIEPNERNKIPDRRTKSSWLRGKNVNEEPNVAKASSQALSSVQSNPFDSKTATKNKKKRNS
jgi:hypothetical protein